MALTVPQIDNVLAEFRRMLPAQSETAKAIDGHAPLDEVAAKALGDGYIDSVGEFLRLVEACVRHH